MAWERIEWSCGHSGSMQLYGKQSSRDSAVAYAAGQDCMACWLVKQWEDKKDPRAMREDRYKLAADIAASKGKRIDVPASVPVKCVAEPVNPLANISTEDLLAELARRQK